MPEHLRALVFILVLAVAVFALAKSPITALANTPENFVRRRNLWFALVLSAFLAHNFWLFMLAASCALVMAVSKEPNRFALYLGVMLAVPRLAASIPAFGVINELFTIEPLRLLSLLVLLPAYLSLRQQPDVVPFGRLVPDKLLLAYLALDVILSLPNQTFTSVLRESIFYAFTDTFLIYYVASRSLKTIEDYRDALGAFVVSAMVFAAIVTIEFLRGWLLYAAVDEALGVPGGSNFYLRRSGRLRAEGSAGQAIVTGYVCAVAIGLYLYVRTLVPTATMRLMGLLVLVAGIIGALSRAPWLGVGVIVVLFMLLGPSPMASLSKLGIAAIALLPVLIGTEGGQVIIDHLPWIGTVDSRNVDGREHLMAVAMQVIYDNPFFGRFDFYMVPAIQDLRGGDGLIDIVNTYVLMALKGGIVTVVLFAGTVVAAMAGLVSSLFKIRDKTDERHVLGRALFATLFAVMFIIATVSPIFFVLPLLWSLTGMAVGYTRLVETSAQPLAARTPPAARGAELNAAKVAGNATPGRHRA